MLQNNYKSAILISIIIAILLAISPILMLIGHHSWNDIFDKIILFLTAFFIAFLNIQFQNWIHTKKYSLLLFVSYTFFFNIFLLAADLLIRIPFWNMLINKPPIVVLVSVECARNLTIGITAFFIVKYINKNKKEIEDKLKINELKNETLQLQINGITAQLQPHFFFNSLNVLAELIQIDKAKSEEYIHKLATFFRYVLSIQQNPLIALIDELNFIETYIYLLKVRFGEAIQVEYSLNKESNFLIPSLCTLIIMENIMKHNNINLVKINFDLDEKNQTLKIKNTIHQKNTIQNNSLGYGLQNINKKCNLLLNRSIKITANPVFFEVEVPLKKEN